MLGGIGDGLRRRLAMGVGRERRRGEGKKKEERERKRDKKRKRERKGNNPSAWFSWLLCLQEERAVCFITFLLSLRLASCILYAGSFLLIPSHKCWQETGDMRA